MKKWLPKKEIDRRRRRRKQHEINKRLKKRFFGHLMEAPCCHCKEIFQMKDLTLEHLLALSSGGTNDKENLALACAPCNQCKGKEAWLLKRSEWKKSRNHEQHPAQHH